MVVVVLNPRPLFCPSPLLNPICWPLRRVLARPKVPFVPSPPYVTRLPFRSLAVRPRLGSIVLDRFPSRLAQLMNPSPLAKNPLPSPAPLKFVEPVVQPEVVDGRPAGHRLGEGGHVEARIAKPLVSAVRLGPTRELAVFVAVSAAAVAVGSLKPSEVTNGLNPRRLGPAAPHCRPPSALSAGTGDDRAGPGDRRACSRSWRRPVDCSPASTCPFSQLRPSPPGPPCSRPRVPRADRSRRGGTPSSCATYSCGPLPEPCKVKCCRRGS